MRIEIPFNEDVSRKQLQMLYELACEKNKKYWRNCNYWGLFIFLLGSAMVFEKSNFGYLFVFFGITLIIGFYVNHYKSKDLHKRLLDDFESTKNMYLENPLSVWEFSENTLTFSQGDKSVLLNWKDFKAYIIKDHVIFMFTKTNHPFILQKDEVGDEYFEKIFEIVSNEIPLSR